MQIALKQLAQHLKQKLLPIYLVSGDVPLLIQESREIIRDAAKSQGFSQRESIHMDTGFDAEKFCGLTQNLSLFAEKRFLEIHNMSAKFDKPATTTLLNYLKSPNKDIVIIIITSKLSSAQQKTNWYKNIDQVGAILPIWPVSMSELPQWIMSRLKNIGLRADHDSIKLLADLTEGNLLATHQTIERLNLLYPQQHITVEKMLTAVINNTRYHIFDLGNYVLQGDSAHVVRILFNLQHESVEPTLVLWVLARELRNLITYTQQLEQGLTITQVLSREWQSRKLLLKTALARHSLRTLNPLLHLASEIDQIIKGIAPGNCWDQLARLGLGLAGTIKI